MPDQPILPKYHELMWPTLRAIVDLGGSATIQEIVEKVCEIARLTPDQQNVLHKNGPDTEIAYRLAWARTYLKGVGAVDNSRRGVWSITELGRAMNEEEVAEVPARYRALYRERRGQRRSVAEPEPGDEEVELDWREQLLDVLMAMSPEGFERLARRLLREAGFINVTVTGRSGDGGIDGTGIYRLSLISFPVIFQCKRWRGSVGPSVVRDFRGAMVGRGDKGLLITTGSFTADARAEATRDGAPPVDLFDGDRLCELLKDFELGVEVTQRTVEDVVIRSEFFGEL
jgi:restriction system protein